MVGQLARLACRVFRYQGARGTIALRPFQHISAITGHLAAAQPKPTHAFSALQAVLMAASAGSFSNLVNENFILDKRVVGGMQSVSLALAQKVGAENIILGHPARVLRWQEPGEYPVRVEAEAFSEDGVASPCR